MPGYVGVRRALERAIKLAGGQSNLARMCDYTQTTIWKAKEAGRVSAMMAIRVEVATGGKVTREQLAPQVFCNLPKQLKELADEAVA